ncbi:MAG: hypothetical protein ACOYIF_08490 [Acetivibrionales bacterium]|jgi:hypothetical protein
MKNIRLAKALIIMLVFILSGCFFMNDSSQVKLNLSNTKYIVSLSGVRNNKDSIILIKDDNSLKQVFLKKSIVIENSLEFYDKLYFISRQMNSHYEIDVNGNVRNIAFLEDMIPKDSYIGILFAN